LLLPYGRGSEKQVLIPQGLVNRARQQAAMKERFQQPASAGKRFENRRKKSNLKKKENQTMQVSVLQAVLWIVAGVFLTLLIIRRGKRKAKQPQS